MTDLRQGGNYTQPDPFARPIEYMAYLGHKLVGRFPTHQEAEAAVRHPFIGREIKHIEVRDD